MKMKGNAKRGDQLAFGSFGIKAVEGTWVRKLKQLVLLSRFMKREGQNGFAFSLTNLLPKNRLRFVGKGKGAPEYWVAPVKQDAFI